MTHARLLRELGTGEIAHWRAFFEIQRERSEEARREVEKQAS